MRLFLRFVLMLAVIAVLTRAIIPAGYMPDIATGKTFQMTICTMNGPMTVSVDEKFRPVSDQKQIAKENCAFHLAGHSVFNSVTGTVFFESPYQIAILQKIQAGDQFVRLHILNPIAQPRAPPVIA